MSRYEELIRKTQSAEGDVREEAFGQLIALFQSAAQGWAFTVLGDANLAQDVTQEAFLTAYQKIDQLRDPAAFPGWLKRIILTYCNRETRGKSPTLTPLEDEDAPAQTDPAATAEDRDMQDQVKRAVRALPDHEREVTELFYITGYSQQEIAEQLALPITTVKKRLQYAREHLRENMPPMNVLSQVMGMDMAIDFGTDDPFDSLELSPDMLELLATISPELFALA